MRGINNFIIKPIKSRYTNTKDIDGTDLILNTDNYNHRYVSKEAIVIAIPTSTPTDIKVGDKVITHHNVFRRWKDIKGVEKNSKSFFKDDLWFVHPDQIFLYKNKDKWKATDTFCFVKPIELNDIYSNDKERPLIGVLKYADKTLESFGLKAGDLVGHKPNTEYECIVDGERLYRIFSKSITNKYEYQGDEKEYNPSWAHSG
mgnify:FL=1|tara:strand:- start:1391 stop:1996 length:606 start_codon:yes stop_codon:yes gene_type:complete